MANNARDELVATFKRLLDSEKYTDLIITCDSDTYKVHKAVVCTRSGVFERAERFPAASGKKSDAPVIDLTGDEPGIVRLLIQYLYEGEYDPTLPDGNCMEEGREIIVEGIKATGYHYKFPHTCVNRGGCPKHNVCQHHLCHKSCNANCIDFICKTCCPNASTAPLLPAEGDATRLLLHAKMYEIGDKYDVNGLKELSREKYLRSCAKFWDSEEFAAAAHYAMSTTPEGDKGLRDIISNTISQHMQMLNKAAIETLLTEFNELAVGLLKMRAKDLGWIKPA